MFKKLMVSGLAVLMATAMVSAQQIPASPEGKSQVQVAYTSAKAGDAYKTGKWIEVTYGRPILRGRTNIFGSGATYGKDLNGGAPIWRAGANVTTRLRTEVPLVIGGKTVPAGEYSVFIDLKEGAWTFVLSNWAHQKTYNPQNKTELWGSYDYTADKDVVRAPMTLSKNTMSVEELTWTFANVSAAGGQLVIMWDKEVAAIPFTVGK
ncbi:MAG: DUF2911 domain-containing protein [Acidobacteria bacterium]|nr:DUF2911 domain-containing protein [Acidobacteriota bacterium]